jgi:hypothetical protein
MLILISRFDTSVHWPGPGMGSSTCCTQRAIQLLFTEATPDYESELRGAAAYFNFSDSIRSHEPDTHG